MSVIKERVEELKEKILKTKASQRKQTLEHIAEIEANIKMRGDGARLLGEENPEIVGKITDIEKKAVVQLYRDILAHKNVEGSEFKDIRDHALVYFLYFKFLVDLDILEENKEKFSKVIVDIDKTVEEIKKGKYDDKYAKQIQKRIENLYNEVKGSDNAEGTDGDSEEAKTDS